MEMSFNWAIDHAADGVGRIPVIPYDNRLNDWIIAEIQADLMDEMQRRNQALRVSPSR
jgi:hypothetical protein